MPDQSTIETYNKYAKVYDEEVIEFWDEFPKSILKNFASNLPGNRVLNLGSGSGRDAVLLRDQGLEVVCVDASKAMVEMTKQLEFESHLADFSELSFANESFDGVWAYTSLIHIPKEQAREVIKHIHSLLKPDGLFLMGAIQGDTADIVERKTMPDTKRYFKFYGRDELKELITPLGFELQHEEDYQPHNSIYLNQTYRVIK